MGRLGGGGLSAYLGNRSEAEIDDQREPEGWSRATSNLSDMRPWERGSVRRKVDDRGEPERSGDS